MGIVPSLPFNPIRILLIDDHASVRAGIRLLIESYRDFVVVGEAGNYSEATVIASREKPDVILLDLVMGEESGLDYLPNLLLVSHPAKVLVLTGVLDLEIHQKAIQLGAIGLLIKNSPPDVLIKAIRKVHKGEAWLDRRMVANVLMDFLHNGRTEKSSDGKAQSQSLTKRESDIIRLVAQGLRNKQIAEQLAISDITVRHHLTSVFNKLGLADRFELIIYAFKNGFCEPLS